MSEDWINQITLNCLMNKQQYEKYLSSKIKKQNNLDNKKLYSPRILDLTKELLDLEEDYIGDTISPDVQYAFENYIKTCIHSFKILDNNQIVQDQYKEWEEEENFNKDLNEKEFVMEKNDSFFLKSIKICNANLDSFFHKPSFKKEEVLIEEDLESEEDLDKEEEKNII